MVAHQTADRQAVDSYHLHTTEIPVKTGDLQHAHLGITPKGVSVSDSYWKGNARHNRDLTSAP